MSKSAYSSSSRTTSASPHAPMSRDLTPAYTPHQPMGGELPNYASECAPSGINSSTRATCKERLTKHRIDLHTTRPRPWLWMVVESEAPNDKSLPVFVERPIVGSVELDVPAGKASVIACVTVSVKGELMASGLKSRNFVFLDMSQTLWDTTTPLPVSIDSSQTSPSTKPATKTGGKLLAGRYSLPFRFTLPHEVTYSDKVARELGVSTREWLPPTTNERGWNTGVKYELVVDVKRVGLLNAHRTLPTVFGYVPLSFPPRPSRAREIAYLNGVVPLGPLYDPEGWSVLPEVELHGMAFKQRKTTIRCSLALAKPLEYTRGCTVPLFLTLRCADKRVLDILAHPHVPAVQLRKQMRVSQVFALGEAVPIPHSDLDMPLSRARWSKPSDVNIAAAGEDGDGKFQSCLVGELTLPSNLPPSFCFGKVELQYFVELHSFRAAGFEPVNDNLLSRTEIVVHTGYTAESPRPCAYLPPGYVGTDTSNAFGKVQGSCF